MDTTAQLRNLCESFLMLFRADGKWDVVLRCVLGIFVFVGFVVSAVFVLLIRVFQSPLQFLYDILNLHQHYIVKVVLLFSACFLLLIKFTIVPILLLCFEIANMFFNLCVISFTKGERNWQGIIFPPAPTDCYAISEP